MLSQPSFDLRFDATQPVLRPASPNDRTGTVGASELLDSYLSPSGLRTLFQPILDLRHGRVYGYEALTRGPANTVAELPAALFELARADGRGAELELLAVRYAVERFASLGLDGKLFVNFSPAVLAERREDPEILLALLRRHGMTPRQLVIELTENGAMSDTSPAWSELLRCRALGFGAAIDDLGEGFASLRLWSELRPEYVKLDKHFVQGVHRDPIKLQMARAIQQIAHVAGATVIAEGIEQDLDFQTVRDLGIRHGQGYLIGRPIANAAPGAAVETWKRLSGGPLAAFPVPGRSVNRVTARHLMTEIAPVAPDTDNDVVYARFEADADLQIIPVVENGVPRGIINRTTMIDRFARPYRREHDGRNPCASLMNPEPLIVNGNISLQELGYLVADGGKRALLDGFMVVDGGRYAGVGSARELIREMTEIQIAAGRYTSPLTLLPGNVPIAEHIERLLSRGCRFAACYCDMDNFKPFNDVFGYQQGDEAIQLTARVLAQAADAQLDFVGHAGGDDFVVVLQSPDWEARCADILRRFELRAASLFTRADRRRGGFVAEDRLGRRRMFPLLSLSIGAVPVEPGTFASHSEVAAAAGEAKRLAKRESGNSLFIGHRPVT
jgi:diguanylate cyclase (GGDEF)-like protein